MNIYGDFLNHEKKLIYSYNIIYQFFLRIPIYYLNCYVEIILIKLPLHLHIGHLFSNFSLQE